MGKARINVHSQISLDIVFKNNGFLYKKTKLLIFTGKQDTLSKVQSRM